MKIIFVGLLSLFSLTAFSQNLSFGQVLTLGEDIPPGNVVSMTVPAGKVWKLENFAFENGVVDMYWISPLGNRIFISSGSSTISPRPGSTTSSAVIQATWFKAGDVLEIENFSSSQTYGYFLSILEFNAP